MKTKSALSYFGSDSEVAGRLAGMLDHCKHVTIPFCGGLSILPHLRARSIVANDLNNYAIHFYRVLGGCFGDIARANLIDRCLMTLSHPSEMESAEYFLDNPDHSIVDSAWAYWAMCWIGRKGKGGTKHLGGLPSVRRTAEGGSNASRIVAAASDLRAWANQFQRCEFEAVCFRELIPKVADRPDCGVYVDAPWVKAGRNYLHSFSEDDHRDLAALLSRFENAAVVVRYDDTELIRELYRDGWNFTELSSRNQSNGQTSEVWITRNIRGDSC
jgi:site-specific DNA-adenine methylase